MCPHDSASHRHSAIHALCAAQPQTTGHRPRCRASRLTRFSNVKTVVSPTGDNSGLGPRFNSNQCSSCHLQPVIGGSSPAINPLLSVASADGARNSVPWFITANGPIRAPMAASMTCSSSRAGAMRGVAALRSRILNPPGMRSPVRVATETSCFVSRRRYRVSALSRRFPMP